MTVQEALERARSSSARTWLVTDGRGLAGVVNFSTLEQQQSEDAARQLREIVDGRDFPHVHLDQGLDLALERMGAHRIELLPVVSRADVHQVLGVVSLRDVLESYGVSQES